MTTVAEGLIDLQHLRPGSLVDVETASRHYYIECVDGNKVRISGHPSYCPEPSPASIHGSIDREGTLEYGLLGQGKRMVFFLSDNRPVTTSKILKVRVSCPIDPHPSSSIH